MSEPRSRRTGDWDDDIAKLRAELAAARATIVALEARLGRLEAEATGARRAGRSAPPVARSSKRSPALAKMPPLPDSFGAKGVVDISELAELIDSVPPAAPAPPGPPRPRKR